MFEDLDPLRPYNSVAWNWRRELLIGWTKRARSKSLSLAHLEAFYRTGKHKDDLQLQKRGVTVAPVLPIQ